MRGTPGYWMQESSGVLRPAIEAYLKAVTEPDAPEMTGEQIATMRAYLRQWCNAPGFRGAAIDELRATIGGLTTRRAISAWIDHAVDAGIDPL